MKTLPRCHLDLERLVVFLVDDPVQVAAAVVPVLHAAGFAVAAELLEVQVVDDHRFDVRIAFGGDGIAGELDVGRREDPRLGVVDVGVLDERQVARAAGDRHVQMVLDAAGLGAMPDAQVAVSRVGVERHEDDLRPLLRGDAGQLGELDVVADLNRDPAAVGIEHLHPVARADAPPLAFAGRDVDLVLLADRAVAPKEVGDVVQRVVFDHELRTADDVDVVLDRHLGEELQVLRRELGQLAGRHARARGLPRRTAAGS